MKDTLKAIYVVLFLLVGVWCNIRVIEPVIAADKPELKIPLDCYYIKAPDGGRLDTYLKNRESKIMKRLIKPTTSPYTVRVATLSSNSADASGVLIKVSARLGGSSAYRSYMVRNLLGSSLIYQQTTSGTPVAITLGIVQLSGVIYYTDISIYDCINGDVYIETERF